MTEDLALKYSAVILVTLIGILAIGMMLLANLLLAPRKKTTGVVQARTVEALPARLLPVGHQGLRRLLRVRRGPRAA